MVPRRRRRGHAVCGSRQERPRQTSMGLRLFGHRHFGWPWGLYIGNGLQWGHALSGADIGAPLEMQGY